MTYYKLELTYTVASTLFVKVLAAFSPLLSRLLDHHDYQGEIYSTYNFDGDQRTW